MTKKKAKKELRSTLQQKLSLVLTDYKNILQEKKYERSLRRASRLLTEEIIEAIDKGAKKAEKKEKPAKQKQTKDAA